MPGGDVVSTAAARSEAAGWLDGRRLGGMDATLTLGEYLDEWFVLQRTRVEPTTWRSYRNIADFYLRPRLGERPLDAITVRELDLHYVWLLEQGGRGGQPLSRATVVYAHTVLHKALADAVTVDLLEHNVAARATLPRIDPRRANGYERVAAWDEPEVRRFLALSAHHELADLWRVALGTGMRRGELLGLRWQDVDLSVPHVRVDAALAFVDGEPRLKGTKTGRSRVLVLDEGTARAIDRQPRRDGAWPLVFARPDGSPWPPATVTDRWRCQWPRLDVPKIRLHDARHCHATLLLARGVPIKVVSERLGHSTVAFTLDTYAHVLPAMDRDAALAIGAALDGL
jgi:integrase